MKVELERSRQTIKKLNTRVSNLMSDVEAISTHAKEQAETISMQQEIMNAQNEQLNIGYIKVGSRKELKQAGLLTKGIFSGSRLNVTSIDFSHFQQIDIRDITEITCNSWHPELLSAHPEGSYSFREDEGEKTTLVIKDPAQFWSIVNYIVIRL